MEIDHALLLRTFAEEADEQIAALEQGLVALETRPADADVLAEVFRAAHTFKGNAGTVGLHDLAHRAHAIEDALDAMRAGTQAVTAEVISNLLRSVDALRSALGVALADEGAEGHVDGATSGSQHRPEERRMLRIDAAKLDRMLSLSGEIAIARGRIRAELSDTEGEDVRDVLERALEAHSEADRLHRELQEEIMQARMVPVGPSFRQYQRVVRDLALQHGKRVDLSITGDDVEIDTTVSDHVRDPLMHMLRNAIDHGVETPAERVARGKDPVGHLTLGARREASNIFIELRDDGAGFDRRRIAERAEQMGKEDVAGLSDGELLRLVMDPGFSTSDDVSDLSGRGVGMDVVRRNVEALRGSVEIESKAGEGATISLRLPLTLAIIDGFFVEVGDGTYVLPLESVVECIELPRGHLTHADGCGVYNFRGQALPYLRLRKLFDVQGGLPPREHLAVVKHGDRHAGIAVDALLGQDQAVIKPLGKVFRDVPAVSGSTITGTGEVALILDVPAVLRLVDSGGGRRAPLEPSPKKEVA